MVQSKYNTLVQTPVLKRVHNGFIAAAANMHIPLGTPKRALVLDDPSLNTTHTLLAQVVGLEEILIVQHDAQHLHAIMSRLPALSARYANVQIGIVHASLGQYLDTEKSLDFNIAYFDYEGEITGNKALDVYPLRDMETFLNKVQKHKDAHADNVVLAVTCSMSRRSKSRVRHVADVEDRLEKLIAHTSFCVDNRWRPEEYVSFKTKMVFGMYALAKMDYNLDEYGGRASYESDDDEDPSEGTNKRARSICHSS